jgi:DNA polymerase III subunit epsilon
MSPNDFVVIDVETANADLSSICQIGIVGFAEGTETSRWESLIDPEDFFDPWNISIHGIDEPDVAGAPTLPDVMGEIAARLSGVIVVSHTHFDRVALAQASEKYELSCPQCSWLDSARVVRRAWPDRYARAGYGLANVAKEIGINYQAHDAASDAWAAGSILCRAIQETGLTVNEWLQRVRQPIHPRSHRHVEYIANPEGALYGEVVCFTGALTVPRRDAAAMAAAAGCTVADRVTKQLTMLVVGDQDVRKLAGHKTSSKHRKAETLMRAGHPIRILTERDFLRIAGEENV